MKTNKKFMYELQYMRMESDRVIKTTHYNYKDLQYWIKILILDPSVYDIKINKL